MPTFDGTSATAGPGALQFLDNNGKLIAQIADLGFINGPWGMAIHDNGRGSAHLFISNVLAGTITRLDVSYASAEAISIRTALLLVTGLSHRPDPAALELGPSGLAYTAFNDTLNFASSADNAIYSLPGAAAASGPLSPTLLPGLCSPTRPPGLNLPSQRPLSHSE